MEDTGNMGLPKGYRLDYTEDIGNTAAPNGYLSGSLC